MSENKASEALKLIPYGFYALTSSDGDEMNAMVLNWFSQVSFEPQHVAIGLQNTAYSMKLVKNSKKFVINIFHKDDAEAIKPFTKSREKNPEKFNDAQYSEGPVTGVPVLDDAAAYLECEVVEIFDTGAGHSVVIAKAVGGDVRKQFKADETLTLPQLGWSYAG
jgi:flavin reductase (DIM6/NTAB) family NADH-FMN oxidoreductase RutF